MPIEDDHPGKALVPVLLERDFTRAEAATFYSYVIDLAADTKEAQSRLEHYQSDDPLAVIAIDATRIIREGLKVSAVTNHQFMAEGQRMFIADREAKAAQHALDLQLAENVAAELRIREAKAQAPTKWTPEFIGAIGVAFASAAAAVYQFIAE